MKKQWIDYFPTGFTPRAQQITLISKIQAAFESGKKFVICCAPTGSGKSFIAKTLSEISKPPSSRLVDLISDHSAFAQGFEGEYIYADECLQQPAHGAFALTITKVLQDQYEDQFSDTAIVKGKSNYTCAVDDSFNTEVAPCVFTPLIKSDCLRHSKCPYYEARKHALLNKFSAVNYKMFFSIPEHVKKKNYVICDEASELEDELVRQFSVSVPYERLKFAGITQHPLMTDNPDLARVWVNDLTRLVGNKISSLTSKNKDRLHYLTSSDKHKISYLRNLHNSLKSLDKNWLTTEYIIEYTPEAASFTPLTVNRLASAIFDSAERILLMSATIIDPANFAKTLGITDYAYIEGESVFDAKKSPIYVSTKHRINHSNLKTILPELATLVRQIVDHHKEDKGIVHTHTQYICDFLRAELKDDYRFLYRSSKDTNESILNDHFATDDPTVVVSPSMAYGVDLKDDLARFQIIVKLPYMPLNQKRIKRLFDIDREWYENKMLNTLVQAAGRATRNENDHSVTYVLDGNIVDVVKRCKHKLPKHFLERFA